jgi:diguanylate cyclase (GGDEF)-like protein
MTFTSLRTRVSAIGLIVALITAVVSPAGYFLVGYSNAANLLELKAELNARYLAKYIYTHNTLWQYQRVRLAELLDQTNGSAYTRKRVIDSAGKLVLEEGAQLLTPVLTRSKPIEVAGTVVGGVEIASSLRQLLQTTGIVAMLSMLLGLGVYFAVRIFPLRVLDRTLGILEKTNRRFDAALGNMSQGLIMFDADERISICNGRYLEMYNLSSDIVKPGCTLSELFAHRVERGHLLRDPEEYRAELLAGLNSGTMINHIVETADGREIAVANKPMRNGGWVSTHEDVTAQRAAHAKIAYMAHHDALTGLPNRILFRNQLQSRLAHLGRDRKLAVLGLDLDRFKTVNDTLGHVAGDNLLRQAGRRLRGCLRDGDALARLGGDEFAVLQYNVDQPAEINGLAGRLNEVLSQPFDLDGYQGTIGVSIGIAVAPEDGTDPDQLLKNADMALYRAKAEGRGSYRFFEPEMDARMQQRRILELDLRQALMKREFELFYQPLVNLEKGEICGFEALLRWHHPARGLVLPMEFIPLAEETGLIIPIGEWVLRQACAEALKWPDKISVAVNLSAVQFRRGSLAETVLSALAHSGLPAGRLELEITESVLLSEADSAMTTLHQLQNLGVRISMDDFGTGYSSLSYLRRFPFDKIKIDRSFVHDITLDQDSIAIVRAVAGLGASLGMSTTGEGVETQAEADFLKKEGCTEAQGYFFGRPRPASEIYKILVDGTPASAAVA